MTDKFLNTGGSGNANITNGSANIYGATLGAENLEPSMPIKTNSVKQLISSNLEIADINNLQSELNNVLTNPFNGTLQATDFKGNSIKDITETSTINLTASEIDLVASSVKVNGQSFDASVDLQDAYDNSVIAQTQLATTKPYIIKAVDTANLLNIDGDTKEIEFNGDLIHNGNAVQFNGATSFQIQNAGSCQIQNTGPLSIKTFSTTGDIVMGGTAKIRNLANGTDPSDAVNLSQIPAPVNITDLETKTQNINLATTTAGTTDITGLVKVDGLSSDNALIIFSPSNLTIDATGDIIVNSLIDINSFILYRSPFVDYLNPTDAASLAAVGYVDQEIANIPAVSKTQNISTLTVAGNTKYSGAQNFYMGALGSADVFSINYGVPSDVIVSRIFDTIGGTVNTTAPLNTTNIIPSVADTFDIGTVSNRYDNVYLRQLFTFGIEMAGTSINGINSGFSLGYQGIANLRINPTVSSFEKDVDIISGNLSVENGGNIDLNGVLNMTGSGGITLNANRITTTNTSFTNPNELVSKSYVDAGGGGSAYELIFAVTNQISNIISTGQKFQIRAPKDFTISKFKLSLNTTAGPNFSVTIRKNGNTVSSVFLNALVQDTTVAETFLEDDIISVDVSNVGTGAASGLICYLLE